ncbi:MAG TPA: hypothetical protein DDW65_24330 [Firmicutes bacterium]|jgi:hypothetical protein|nr:hypothetical protein [Bacillota bacterium]
MITIDLHGFTLAEAQTEIPRDLENAYLKQEQVIRIIHGQGKHSEFFPVIKSFIRHWLAESEFAKKKIAAVYRGEDGSPYTLPNAGETIIVLKIGAEMIPSDKTPIIEVDQEEAREARRNAKAIRADHLRVARRRGPRSSR